MEKKLLELAFDNIKDVMKRKKISQQDLAKRMSTTQPYVSQLLNRTINPTIETLEKIASALDVPVKDFFQNKYIQFPFADEDNTFIVVSCGELKRAFVEWDREVRSTTHTEETISITEAREILGCSMGAILRFRNKGLLHQIKIGKNIYFRKYEVEQLLKTGTK